MNFFGCRNYKSKAVSGCGYFDWVDDKVVALNEKIALVNVLNDRIDLVSIVQQLEHKVQELESENHDLVHPYSSYEESDRKCVER
ncbi:hypothetical protein LINPERHAP2_LOCUS24599 [Linum perenne]